MCRNQAYCNSLYKSGGFYSLYTAQPSWPLPTPPNVATDWRQTDRAAAMTSLWSILEYQFRRVSSTPLLGSVLPSSTFSPFVFFRLRHGWHANRGHRRVGMRRGDVVAAAAPTTARHSGSPLLVDSRSKSLNCHRRQLRPTHRHHHHLHEHRYCRRRHDHHHHNNSNCDNTTSSAASAFDNAPLAQPLEQQHLGRPTLLPSTSSTSPQRSHRGRVDCILLRRRR